MDMRTLLMAALISLSGGIAGYALLEWLRRRRNVARLGGYLLMAVAAALGAANVVGESSALVGIAFSVLLITSCVILVRQRETGE